MVVDVMDVVDVVDVGAVIDDVGAFVGELDATVVAVVAGAVAGTLPTVVHPATTSPKAAHTQADLPLIAVHPTRGQPARPGVRSGDQSSSNTPA